MIAQMKSDKGASVADFDMHKRASEMQGPETLKPVAQRIRDEL